jgi:hypothetical protein
MSSDQQGKLVGGCWRPAPSRSWGHRRFRGLSSEVAQSLVVRLRGCCWTLASLFSGGGRQNGSVTHKICQTRDKGANVNRLFGTAAIALIALAACSGGSKDASAPIPPTSTSSGTSTTSGVCTSETAKSVRQVLVSTSGFDATCVKAAVGHQVFFINNSDKAQSLKTAAGAPESFQVVLPKKTSTYARVFKAKGTYLIAQAGGGTVLTLVVG